MMRVWKIEYDGMTTAKKTFQNEFLESKSSETKNVEKVMSFSIFLASLPIPIQ